MDGDERSRLRLKLPSGLEVEAEGRPEFVRTQIQELLSAAGQGAAPEIAAKPGPLEAAVSQAGSELRLRALDRSGDPEEVALVLMLASEKLLGLGRPTAAQLARWLRKSGYNVKRIDRSLGQALRNGLVLASGARRSRRYELAAKGRIRALVAAERLSRVLREGA